MLRDGIGNTPYFLPSKTNQGGGGVALPLVRRVLYKKAGTYPASAIIYPTYDVTLDIKPGLPVGLNVNKLAPSRWTAVNVLEIDYTVSFPVATATNLDVLLPAEAVMLNNVNSLTFINLGLNIADIDIMQSPTQAATIRFNKRTAFVKSLRFTARYVFTPLTSVTLAEGEFTIDCWHIPVGFGKGINGINYDVFTGLQCADLRDHAVAPGTYTSTEYTTKHLFCAPDDPSPIPEYLFYISIDK